MSGRKRRILGPLIIGGLGTVVLVFLCQWQVQRMIWKDGIIQEIETRIAADPVDLPPAPDPEADKYLAVKVHGVLEPDELHVLTSQRAAGPGFRVITPLLLDDGTRILLDRGFVPADEKTTPRSTGALDITGNLIWPDETDDYTPPVDAEKNIWFARDVGLMAATLETRPVMVSVRTETPRLDGEPEHLPVGENLVNPHVEYALTWGGLAIIWIFMSLHWLRLRLRG